MMVNNPPEKVKPRRGTVGGMQSMAGFTCKSYINICELACKEQIKKRHSRIRERREKECGWKSEKKSA